MSKEFTRINFKVTSDAAKAPLQNDIKFRPPEAPTVKEFQIESIQEESVSNSIRDTLQAEALSGIDGVRIERRQRDRRFSLNSLAKESLLIDQEEQRVIDKIVADKIATLSEQERVLAREEGYQEGLRKGHEEAFNQTQEEGKRILENLSQILEDFEIAKTSIFQENEKVLIDLVYKVAKMLFLKDISTDKDYTLRLTKEILNKLEFRDGINIKIGQGDVDLSDSLKKSLSEAFGSMKNLNIEVSSQVKLGGCIIETDWNRIDATIETQLSNIHQLLREPS